MFKREKDTFYIQFSCMWYSRGHILLTSNGIKVKILRAYRKNWWTNFLTWLGFKPRINQYKVKYLKL
jgi:hypothetical protein